MVKKHSRRSSRKHRTHRRRHHRMRGGYSSPASVSDVSMEGMSEQSMAQGRQFASMHANQHGGAGPLEAGPYPMAVTEQNLLPEALRVVARVAPLDAADNAIKGMSDQTGGARRRRGRKGSKKSKKSRKGRKASRKSRKTRRQRGGAAYVSSPAPVNASGMLLDHSQMTKALSGMSSEWRLAEDPAAFAPGVAPKNCK